MQRSEDANATAEGEALRVSRLGKKTAKVSRYARMMQSGGTNSRPKGNFYMNGSVNDIYKFKNQPQPP